jgi:hypothetical protein
MSDPLNGTGSGNIEGSPRQTLAQNAREYFVSSSDSEPAQVTLTLDVDSKQDFLSPTSVTVVDSPYSSQDVSSASLSPQNGEDSFDVSDPPMLLRRRSSHIGGGSSVMAAQRKFSSISRQATLVSSTRTSVAAAAARASASGKSSLLLPPLNSQQQHMTWWPSVKELGRIFRRHSVFIVQTPSLSLLFTDSIVCF